MMSEHADERKLMRSLGKPGKMFANLHTGNRGPDRAKFAAVGLRRSGFMSQTMTAGKHVLALLLA